MTSKPWSVDPTRYIQSEQVLKAMSVTDEYFVEDKPEDPLVLIIDALLSTLPEDERAVVEMVLMSGFSQHEAARVMGYINSSGKEDHKKVTRRLVWALRKLRNILDNPEENPTFAMAIAGHKLPIDLPKVNVTDTLLSIIKRFEEEIGDDIDE